MNQDGKTDQVIGENESEDTGESTLSSDIEEDDWIINRRSFI